MATLRIMTANLLVDRADPNDLRRVLDEVDPDVLAVQELGNSTAAVINERFPYGHLDPREDSFGLGVVAKREVTVEALPLEARSGWVARLNPSDWGMATPLEVLAVHLVNPIDWPWTVSRHERRAQIEGIADRVGRSDAATVVIGDMNSTPAWPEYAMLASLGVDAAAVTGTAERTWAHFHWGPRWIRIDHAFVSGATPVTTRVVPIRATDHRSLVVDLDV
jgi:endonuclease/exonuclease/phosphatase (EEP) superfamily protein YafD